MERLTERKRNFNGTAISKKSMIDREGYPTVSDYASKVLTKLADYKVCDFSHDCKDCTLTWLQKESEE